MARNKKNYVVIVRDHSGSMRGLKRPAARDYNTLIAALKAAALKESIDTIVSTVKCGDARAYGTNLVSREVVNSSVQALREIFERDYDTDGGSTPLFDSVGEALSILSNVPDYVDESVSFLVMVITDGAENSSRRWTGLNLGNEIKRLQATDRWTFTFRVPKGHASTLAYSLGIPLGNVLEWEQTERGFEAATSTTRAAIEGYYTSRSLGAKSVQTFYTDLKDVSARDLKAALVDIRVKVDIFKNGADVKTIREFCEHRTKKPFLKGAAFYELVKPEREVQDYKMIVIRDRQSGAVYYGAAARGLLGLPSYGTVKLVPGDHSKYDVFVQSTSTNRKITPHTRVLYYPDVGVPFTEGPSARS